MKELGWAKLTMHHHNSIHPFLYTISETEGQSDQDSQIVLVRC